MNNTLSIKDNKEPPINANPQNIPYSCYVVYSSLTAPYKYSNAIGWEPNALNME